VEAIKRSLETYGQRKPIVVNGETGYIEAGNGLWEAAKLLGWEKIAAVKVWDDPTMATGYALMDNQSALLAEWDLPVLKDLLEELDTGAFDMDLTGFDTSEIEDLMTQFHVPEKNKEYDENIEMQNKCPQCGYEW
jgi:ParB-like chromosome segregation protein Spo0J